MEIVGRSHMFSYPRNSVVAIKFDFFLALHVSQLSRPMKKKAKRLEAIRTLLLFIIFFQRIWFITVKHVLLLPNPASVLPAKFGLGFL